METTKDRELAAKACFMAAKCEQNKFYNLAYDRGKLYNQHDEFKNEKNIYRNYFRKPTDNYSDTGFYKEALEECMYFNDFVSSY